ncbi:hypothetical protein GCM10027074_39030 [Streptomyces deserti]
MPEPEGPQSSTTRVGMGGWELTGHQCEASIGRRTTLRVGFEARITPQLPSVVTRSPGAVAGGSGDGPQAGLQATAGTVGYATGPVAGLKPNPLAGTGVTPLDNGVGTQVADFQPVSPAAVTGPVAQASSVGAMPVVGQATGPLFP